MIAEPGQTQLSYAPLSPAMAEDLARLHKVIAEADGAMWPPSSGEIVEYLSPSATFDPRLDTWGVWAGEELVAFTQVSARRSLAFDGTNNVHVDGGVHPAWRGRGIGSHLLALAEARGLERGREIHSGVPVVLNSHTTTTAPAASALLTDNGYVIARYWFDMTHDLSGAFTQDARTQPMTPDLYEATRLAHNDAFSTHWGSGPSSVEIWEKFIVGAPGFRPDLSRIAVRDGEVLAYAVVSSTTPGEAYFELVGVRGAAQRQGLGRAVLSSGLAAIQAAGDFHEAGLDVDADNPSGAGGLYLALGFTNVSQKVTWQKQA